jgi:hypothetical protein
MRGTARGLAALVAITLAAACKRAPDPGPAPASRAEPVAAEPAPAVAVAPPLRPPPRPAELSRVTLKALGMYCEETCPLKVRYALADVHAVYELGFDLSTESIFVSYDASLGPAAEVTKPMLAAIKQAGFDPWLARETWPEDAKAEVVPR